MASVFNENAFAEAYGWSLETIDNMSEDRARDHLILLDEKAKEEQRRVDALKRKH